MSRCFALVFHIGRALAFVNIRRCAFRDPFRNWIVGLLRACIGSALAKKLVALALVNLHSALRSLDESGMFRCLVRTSGIPFLRPLLKLFLFEPSLFLNSAALVLSQTIAMKQSLKTRRQS